jgi:hypothetical protein
MTWLKQEPLYISLFGLGGGAVLLNFKPWSDKHMMYVEFPLKVVFTQLKFPVPEKLINFKKGFSL